MAQSQAFQPSKFSNDSLDGKQTSTFPKLLSTSTSSTSVNTLVSPVAQKSRASASSDSKPTKLRSPSVLQRLLGRSSSSIDQHSVTDYLMVGYIVATIPWAVAQDSLRNLLVPKKKRRSLWNNSYGSLMGHCYKSATLSQLRILTGGNKPLKSELSSWMYTFTGANRGLPNYNGDFSGTGFSGRWLSEIPNRTVQDPVIVYMHGGGYAMKTEFPQVFYMLSLARALKRYRVSIVVLDYTITPFGEFPVQRNQGMALVAALQTTCHNVVFFGDSCGGNMGLSLLLDTTQPVAIDLNKVAGLVLVSPWIDPNANTGSMLNRHDILSIERLADMAQAYCDPPTRQSDLVNPSVAKPSVWQRILPSRTLLVYGEDECLHDQIDKWRQTADIQSYYVESNGTHDCILRGSWIAPSRYISRALIDWFSAPGDEDPVQPNHQTH